KRSLLVFNLLAIAGFALVVAIPNWRAVVIGSFLFLSWSAISLPGTMGLVSKSLPKQKHVMGVSLHSLVRRIPMALGPVIGGIFIDAWGPVTGVRLAFAAAIVMALMALVMQQILIEEDKKPAAPREIEKNPLRVLRGFSRELKSLLVSDILIRFCEQIPYAYVVVWCMKGTARISATQFGVLTSVEMATAALCYLPVARLADPGGEKPFVLRGLKEFGEPTRKALIMELAPEDRKAAAFGAYYLCRDTVISLAALGGSYLWTISPALNLLTA